MSRIEISNLNSAASFLTELTATDTIQITGGSSYAGYYEGGVEEDFDGYSYYSYEDGANGDDDYNLTEIG